MTSTVIPWLNSQIADLTRERDELREANSTLIRENGRLFVELTHRVGWEERCLRAEAALRQILEDPDAKILDSHRDDGWDALGKANCLLEGPNRMCLNSGQGALPHDRGRSPLAARLDGQTAASS
jgi:hypothetical protein